MRGINSSGQILTHLRSSPDQFVYSFCIQKESGESEFDQVKLQFVLRMTRCNTVNHSAGFQNELIWKIKLLDSVGVSFSSKLIS